MELFAALLCAVRPFSGSPFPRPLVFIELVTGFVVWSAFAFVEHGCFVRPVRAFVLSELPLLVTRSSPKKKKKLGREYNAFSPNKHSQPWTIAGEEA